MNEVDSVSVKSHEQMNSCAEALIHDIIDLQNIYVSTRQIRSKFFGLNCISNTTKLLISERKEFVRITYKNNKCPTNKQLLREMSKKITTFLINDRKHKLTSDIEKYGTWKGLKKIIQTKRSGTKDYVPIIDDLNQYNEFVAKMGNCNKPEEFVSVYL